MCPENKEPAFCIPDHGNYFDPRHDQHLASLAEWFLSRGLGGTGPRGMDVTLGVIWSNHIWARPEIQRRESPHSVPRTGQAKSGPQEEVCPPLSTPARLSEEAGPPCAAVCLSSSCAQHSRTL